MEMLRKNLFKANLFKAQIMFGFICALLFGITTSSVLAADEATLREIAILKERLAALEAQIADDSKSSEVTTITPVQEKTFRDIATEIVKDSKPDIHVGGALRFNYGVKDWDDAQGDKGGDMSFDTFRLNLDGTIGDIIMSAEYRLYEDYHFIEHGYLGYNFTEDLQIQAGIHKVPFGVLDYACNDFWGSGAYYIGLEDDNDMGLKLLYSPGNWDFAAAFYKNGEFGNAGDATRYSTDVISNADGGYAGAQAAGNEETNQGNLRAAYTFTHSDDANTEIGLSGEYGGLYNNYTGDMGDHWATAVHLDGKYGPFGVMLEYAQYEFNPENPAGFDDDIVTMGLYGSSFGVPAKGDFAIFNFSYSLPVEWGPVTNLTFYSDNTIIMPEENRFDDIWQNVLGTSISAGPLFVYVDLISGENMIFSGGSFVDPDNERTTRLNINVGYYF
jgi:hypothetical protein